MLRIGNANSGNHSKMRQKTVITKLLQSVTEVYYKVCQILQSASGIAKCDSYYKVRRNRVAIRDIPYGNSNIPEEHSIVNFMQTFYYLLETSAQLNTV